MSSNSTQTQRLTYWCHQCDMSVSLVFPSTASPPCPHCHLHFLEVMDSPPNTTNTIFDFNFNFIFDLDCDDHNNASKSKDSATCTWESSLRGVVIADCLSQDQELCVICKDEFCLNSEAKQLPCKHIYHSECILPWLSHNSSCPLCRFQFHSSR